MKGSTVHRPAERLGGDVTDDMRAWMKVDQGISIDDQTGPKMDDLWGVIGRFE